MRRPDLGPRRRRLPSYAIAFSLGCAFGTGMVHVRCTPRPDPLPAVVDCGREVDNLHCALAAQLARMITRSTRQ